MRKIVLLLFFVIISSQVHSSTFLKIYFSDGETAQYELTTVSKVTFTPLEMVVHLTDASVIEYELKLIQKYIYTEIDTTEISYIATEPSVNIHPNPSSGSCKIDIYDSSSFIRVKIFDMLGNLIEEYLIDNPETHISKKINLEPYKNGVYIVEVSNTNSKTAKKIILIK